MPDDPINHPAHYTRSPSGVECIEIAQHLGFCLGNALKYIWRVDQKGQPLEDLQKARWYIDREIARRGGVSASAVTSQAEEELRLVLTWLHGERDTAARHGAAGDARLAQWADCFQYVHDCLRRFEHRSTPSVGTQP